MLIKFHSLHFLFRVFAYLADKSGGWYVFTKPKLLLGMLILSVSACGQTNKPTKSSAKVKKDKQAKADTAKYVITEEETFCYVMEQMPTYPGGEETLLKFIGKNLNYPKDALANKIEGSVIVRFVVTKEGSVDKVEVIKSLNPACDTEAVRVVKMLSKWIPGKQNGENVSVYYTIPIKFKLKK